jgi:GTP diphosphokinase / guanosine-3',5'-bis(diphosphate) 3'-diphosphatase
MVRIDDILDVYLVKRPGEDIARIQRAYIYSAKQHEGQIRKSGEPYMTHPLSVAMIVAEMGLDEASICAALLHDTIEDTNSTAAELSRLFGDDVAQLVDGVTKLSGVNFTRKEERQAESFRKLLMAMTKDIRVLLLKLADRLHNMRTLEFMSETSRERIAAETRDIYAPLADRLGIAWMRAELDDIAFQYLEPAMYVDLSSSINRLQKAREQFIKKTISDIDTFLTQAGFSVKVTGRLKNLYSIYRKMYDKGVSYEDVHDEIAFRVLCETVQDCYGILGMIHSRWMPVPGRFKDYIAMPKPNNYQSLHTTVINKEGDRIEVQIRTEEMHRIAEYGIAAHWAYKEKRDVDSDGSGYNWLRELMENQHELRDAREFIDSVKVDLFTDEVFVFTPKGDVRSLPLGSTPIDFAYAIHTEVGKRCMGARVNGAQVPLKTQLRNGDTVEIITSKNQRPSPGWLDMVASSRARNKIRAFLRAEQREQSRHAGHELMEKALRRYGRSYSKLVKQGALQKVAADLKFGNAEDLVSAVGCGKVEAADVLDRIIPEAERSKSVEEPKENPFKKVIRKVTKQDGGIVVDGMENLLIRFARCCDPMPGEEIVGYVSRGRGIVVHRRDCSRAAVLDPERRTKAQWSQSAVSHRPVALKVTTTHQTGILAMLSSIFQKQDININSANCQADGGNQAENIFTFNVKDIGQLTRLMRIIRQTKGVLGVERIHS